MKGRGLFLIGLLCSLILLDSLGCGKPKEEEKVTLKVGEKVVTLAEVEPKEVKGTTVAEEGEFTEFVVYRDKGYKKNHYVPSGWMGDYGDVGINENWKDDPYNGTTCMRVTYSGRCSQDAGWAGVYWQDPANNWGYREGGFDLTGAGKLTFWARGEKGAEVIAEFKMGGIGGDYPDSDSASIGPVVLTSEWAEYSITLEGVDLSHIAGGFCWVARAMDNPEGSIFYLDEIKYE